MALNHGVSLSFYFDDPEGHLIEVFWPTGVACRPCHGDPINLTLSEEALRTHMAELAIHSGAPWRERCDPAGYQRRKILASPARVVSKPRPIADHASPNYAYS